MISQGSKVHAAPGAMLLLHLCILTWADVSLCIYCVLWQIWVGVDAFGSFASNDVSIHYSASSAHRYIHLMSEVAEASQNSPRARITGWTKTVLISAVRLTGGLQGLCWNFISIRHDIHHTYIIHTYCCLAVRVCRMETGFSNWQALM